MEKQPSSPNYRAFMLFGLWSVVIVIVAFVWILKLNTDAILEAVDVGNNDKQRRIEELIVLNESHKARADFYLGQTYQLLQRVIWFQSGFQGDQKAYLEGLLKQVGLDLETMVEDKK